MKYHVILRDKDNERLYFCFQNVDDAFSFIKLVLKSSDYVFSIIEKEKNK